MSAARGTCPWCGYSIRLRRDGTIGAHRLWWDGPKGSGYCVGEGDEPRAPGTGAQKAAESAGSGVGSDGGL